MNDSKHPHWEGKEVGMAFLRRTQLPTETWHRDLLFKMIHEAIEKKSQSLLPTDQAAPSPLKVVSSSFGGCTGINDYILNDGQVLTCRPSELVSKLSALQSAGAAPKRDEEIEQLAIKHYGNDPYCYGAQRDGFKEGYKAALQLEKEPEDRWIAVTPETMPEQMDMNVLLLHKTYGVFQGYLMQFGEQWASVRYSGKVPYQLNEVSHWMPTTAIPLPSAPKTITE